MIGDFLVFLLLALMIYAPTYRVTHQLVREWYKAFIESKIYIYCVWRRWDRHKPKYADCWCNVDLHILDSHFAEYQEIEEEKRQPNIASNQAMESNSRIYPLP